jgi:G3E family GTPase
MDNTARRLPLLVIGGYLGAGKTTLVNHLLRHAHGRRVAVLVNDFGSINIDAELVSMDTGNSEAGVISLAGGCLCCSFGDDLVGTLQALSKRQPAVDVVLVELSGVAQPAQVARTAKLASGVELVGCLVLVDATAIQAQAHDPYVGETVRQQLRQADSLLLNKAAILGEQTDGARTIPTLPDLEAWLSQAAPQGHCLTLEAHELPASWIWDWCEQQSMAPGAWPDLARALPLGNGTTGAASFAGRPLQAKGAADTTFVSCSLALPPGCDLTRLGKLLADPAHGVIRAKGLALQADGSRAVLQLASGRWTVTPVSAGGTSDLVVIGLRGTFREDELRQQVQACGESHNAALRAADTVE